MAEDGERIIDKLIQAEINFLRERKLPKPTDNTGIGALQVDFINTFGSVRASSLFSSPRSIYSVAAYIQGRNITEATVTVVKRVPKKRVKRKVKTARETKDTKRKRRKVMGNEEKVKKNHPLSYSDEEIEWFKNYPILEHFGKKEQEKLAKEHEAFFPDRLRRSADALAWKLMNLRGRWNPDRKPGEKKPKKEKAAKHKRTKAVEVAAPSRKKQRGHRLTVKQEAFLLERMPERGSFKYGELGKLHKDFNAAYGTNLSYTSIRIKCNRLRKSWKKTIKEVGKMMKRAPELMQIEEAGTKRKTHKYTSEQLAWIKRQPHPGCGSIELKALTEEFNKLYATEDNPPASLRAYHEKSAIVHGLRKKTTRVSAVRVGRVKYTPAILDFLGGSLLLVGNERLSKGSLRKIQSTLKKDYGLSVTLKALEVKLSRLRKEMKETVYTTRIPVAGLEKARAAHDKILADLADAGKITTPQPQMRTRPLEDIVLEAVTPGLPVTKAGEWIVVDGSTIIWTGDHKPENICVYGGVSTDGKQTAQCTVSIDNHVLPMIFTDHKPEPRVYKEVR